MKNLSTNPFRFGALALDDAFADREAELAELTADIRNGQDVVVFAPRRLGKSSLVWKAAGRLTAEGVLVAQVDLMTTPSKESLAAALASSIYEEIASTLDRVKERALAPFRGLQVAPSINVDPNDGSFSFSFGVEHRQEDIDATLQRLLELPAELGAAKDRRTALVMDEFQEIVRIDEKMPQLLRSIFQRQPEVAHVYLGSKRHVMERIFNDANEPFWRSAKSVELGPIPAALFGGFLQERFAATGKALEPPLLDRLLDLTSGHPYATQQLCYFLWEQVPPGGKASPEHLEDALRAVVSSEHGHFSLLWERASKAQKLLLQALAMGPGRPFSKDYRQRRSLGAATNVQRALGALVADEIVAGDGGEYRIAEPFLADWINARPGKPPGSAG